MRLMTPASFVVVSASLFAAGSTGCTSDLFNRDQDTLDRFSHAYTDFLDAGETA